MKIDYRDLKRRIRLIDLLERIGWQCTEGRGEQLRGPCPLPGCQLNQSSSSQNTGSRKSDNRALSLNTSKNVYRCFRCQSAGNALDFWQAYRNTTLHAAATELHQTLEIRNHNSVSKLPENPQHSSSHPAKLADS